MQRAIFYFFWGGGIVKKQYQSIFINGVVGLNNQPLCYTKLRQLQLASKLQLNFELW